MELKSKSAYLLALALSQGPAQAHAGQPPDPAPRGSMSGRAYDGEKEKIKKDPPALRGKQPKKLDAKVTVTAKNGVYSYSIDSAERVTSFQLDVPGARVTGSPKGWDYRESENGVVWIATRDNGAKTVSGFEIAGSPEWRDVHFFLIGRDAKDPEYRHMVGGWISGPAK